jgi:hypothetical protein
MIRGMDTTAIAMETVQTAGWPTQQEAADALGVSTKTIQKYVAQGRLTQAMQSQINKPARAVIEPTGLERMVRERSRVGEEGSPNGSANLPAIRSGMALEPLLELFAKRETPLSELAHKLYLTEDEAIRYTGLGRGALARMVKAERLKAERIGPHGAVVYRRTYLEAL